MKIRTDFVTNSSSSSYIIAYKNKFDFDEATLAKYPQLNLFGEMIEKILTSEGGWGETNAGEKICSLRGLEEHILDLYGHRATIDEILSLSEFQETKTMYEKLKKLIEGGYIILLKEVDTHEDAYIGLLESLEDGENIVFVEGDFW